ncbi:GNAT family N-acetyltransferase [Streptomyces sp. DW26H14]|uniref:GNAT family N-acetyltransferase n=1 Tax=Streptomyces sp. DW26H14 TaxID=3435395 RepID=UPI00403DA8E1
MSQPGAGHEPGAWAADGQSGADSWALGADSPPGPGLPPSPPPLPGPGVAVRIVGEGLVLREWSAADVPAMTRLFDDPDVARFTPLPSPFDEAAARAYLDRAAESRALGRRVQLAITTDGLAPLGEILFFTTADDPFALELGYTVGPRHRGQRLATRSVRLATAYAYGTLRAGRVVLRIVADNAPSRAVARATGFHPTDAPPITRGGTPLDTWQYGARSHADRE